MIKKITLIVCLLGSYFTFFGQTLNESQGTGTLGSITSGDYNTAFGDSTMTELSSGSMNTALGYKAGHNITTGSEGVYIGYEAGFTDDNGFDNTMIGFRAGYYNTDGDNTFIGNAAGFNNTLGSDNTFIGERAGARVTTGDDCTYIGAGAGGTAFIYSTTTATNDPATGSDNTAVGADAGYSLTTGYRNVFVGSDAGEDVTEGARNTTVGDSAGVDIGVGNGNTMIGQGAGAATEHADFNTFVGASAGWDNNRTNGTGNANRNTYVGTATGHTNRQGEDNVGMGAFADFGGSGYGNYWTEGSGNLTNVSRTTFIGANADAGANDVTMLGYETRVDDPYGIAIGSYARVEDATGAIGIGYLAALSDNADKSIGIGREVTITNKESVAIGMSSIVQNDGSIVIGHGATSMDLVSGNDPYGDPYPDATNTIAIGYNAASSGNYAVAIGSNSTATIDNTMVLGGATYPLSVGIGTDTPNANASLTLEDTNKGLLVNRLTTAQKTTLEGNLVATDYGMVVFDTDLKGLYVWDGTQWLSALADDLGSHTATATLDMATNTIDNATYLDFDNTEGFGVRFWNGNDNYKISMGNSTEYQYGPITGYSIKNSMNTTAGRGWTWGVNGQTPIAALDNTGKMQIANTMTIGAYTLPNTDGTTAQVLSTDGAGAVAWTDATVNTDAQDLSLSGTTLSLTNDGTTVDLSVLQDGTGTDSQEISLATNTLSISGGTNTVDLSAYVNTDTQNLTAATLTGSIIQIDIQNGSSVSVDISPLIADLENRVTTLEACDCNVLPVSEFEMGKMNPLLQQNIPNPFNGTSTIGYYVPQTVSQAEIVFSNNVGQIVNRIAVKKKGEGEISVDASSYASGMYYYTLYLDGKKIDTKKMIVN